MPWKFFNFREQNPLESLKTETATFLISLGSPATEHSSALFPAKTSLLQLRSPEPWTRAVKH